MCTVFQPQLSHIRMRLRPETLPYPGIMSPHSLGRAYHLVWGIPLLQAQSLLLSLLKVHATHGTCPAPPLYLSSKARGQGSFHCEYSIAPSTASPCCVFLGNSDTKMPRTEVWRVFPGDREPVCGTLPDTY